MIAGHGVPNSNTHTNNVLGPIMSVCRQQNNFQSGVSLPKGKKNLQQ